MGPIRAIKEAASGHGHGCTCETCLAQYQTGPRALDMLLVWRVAAAAVLFAASWILLSVLPAISLLAALAACLAAGYDWIVRTVADCLRRREIDEDLLMLITVIAAFSLGCWVEGTFGMLLLQTGIIVRCHALETTRRTLEENGVRPDRERKARIEEFIGHFARLYTPVVLGIAVVMAVALPLVMHAAVGEGVRRALLLMVIACPCAFVVTAPLTYRAGLGAAAQRGLCLRSTGAEDDLCRVGTLVFDQRTSLEGEGLRVVSVKSERLDAETLLRIAAHACAYSDGEVARGIKAAFQDTIYIELIQSFTQDPGRGITVEVENVPILLGTEEFVREHGVDPGEDATPERSVYLGIDGRYAGRILLAGVPKLNTGAALGALAWESERKLVMLSEEPPAAAEKFARTVGLGEYYADCTPETRADHVRRLREERGRRRTLLYAGDPAADPSCFELADVGLAAAGEADILTDDPGPASALYAIDGARRVRTIVRQNLYGALAFKVLVLLLDIAGFCPLWLAFFADSGVTLAASLNALRALSVRAVHLDGEESL